MAKKRMFKRQRQLTQGRGRLAFSFWLKLADNYQLWLARECEDLKRQRKFSRAIREGVGLWVDFMQNETANLERLFPGVVQKLVRKYEGEEIKRLRQELENLQYRLEIGSVETRRAPVVRDDTPLEITDLDEAQIAQNFLNSLGL